MPRARIWEDWAAYDDRRVVDIPGIGRVARSHAVTGVDLPFVSFRSTYRFHADGTVLTSDTTLRYRGRDDLTVAGFQVRGPHTKEVILS